MKVTSLGKSGSSVLCLDLATTSGIAYLERGKRTVVLSTHKGTPLELKNHINQLIWPAGPIEVFIEGLHMIRNMKTVMSLAERIGYIKYYMIDYYAVNVTMINLGSARSYLGCRTKEDVGFYFANQTDSPDEADAAAIMALVLQRMTFPVLRLTKTKEK